MQPICLDLELEVAEEDSDPPTISERPMRISRQPEQYNPESGRSYAQIESCHNIVTQQINRSNMLQYVQQSNVRRGLREFAKEGVLASKAGLQQMHDRIRWRSITVKKLTRREK